MRTHYDTLGIPATASREEVIEAYNREAPYYQKHAPKGEIYASQLRALNEACRILSNSELRRQYDESLFTYKAKLALNAMPVFFSPYGSKSEFFKSLARPVTDTLENGIMTLGHALGATAYFGKTMLMSFVSEDAFCESLSDTCCHLALTLVYGVLTVLSPFMAVGSLITRSATSLSANKENPDGNSVKLQSV